MNVVGVDIGGTFTDLVGCVDGRIVTSKTSTVPADPTRGVAESLSLEELLQRGQGIRYDDGVWKGRSRGGLRHCYHASRASGVNFVGSSFPGKA